MLCPVVLSKSGKQFEIFRKVFLLFTEVGKNQIASEGEGAMDWRLKTLLGSRAWERIGDFSVSWVFDSLDRGFYDSSRNHYFFFVLMDSDSFGFWLVWILKLRTV